MCNARVEVDGQTISFLPDTSRDEYGNIIVVFGQYFENVILVLKRVEFGAVCEQEQLTIEVKVRRLMGETVATAGKDGYSAELNIEKWQSLGVEAYESDSVKYRAAKITHWNSEDPNPPFALGTTVEESFLSLQTTSLYAFAGDNGPKKWYSDLPCLQYIDNSPFVAGPIEVFEADMPNLVDGGSMFQDCTHLTSFSSEMPSLTNCVGMFNGCSGLKSFSTPSGTLPNSITNTQQMFDGCSGLKSWSVELPNSITDATAMFEGCSGLTSWTVALPNSIRYAKYMFAYCSGLTSWNVALPNSITDISGMFNGCSGLKSFSAALPDSITDASYMFYRCSGLTSWTVALPNTITRTGWLSEDSGMFSGCTGLESFTVSMPTGLTKNARYMFYGCKLNLASVKNISETIQTCTGISVSDKTFTLGIAKSLQNNTEVQGYLQDIRDKDWTVEVSYNA